MEVFVLARTPSPNSALEGGGKFRIIASGGKLESPSSSDDNVKHESAAYLVGTRVVVRGCCFGCGTGDFLDNFVANAGSGLERRSIISTGILSLVDA